MNIIQDAVGFCLLQDLDFMLSNDFNKVYTFLKRQHGKDLTPDNVVLSIPTLTVLNEGQRTDAWKMTEYNLYRLNMLTLNLLLRSGEVELNVPSWQVEQLKKKYHTAGGILSDFYSHAMRREAWTSYLDADSAGFINDVRSKIGLGWEARKHLLDLCADACFQECYRNLSIYEKKKSKKGAKTTVVRPMDPSFTFFLGLALGGWVGGAHRISDLAYWWKDYVSTRYYGRSESDLVGGHDRFGKSVTYHLLYMIQQNPAISEPSSSFCVDDVISCAVSVMKDLTAAYRFSTYDPTSRPYVENFSMMGLTTQIITTLGKLVKPGSYAAQKIVSLKEVASSLNTDSERQIMSLVMSLSDDPMTNIETLIQTPNLTTYNTSVGQTLRPLCMKLIAARDSGTLENSVIARFDAVIQERMRIINNPSYEQLINDYVLRTLTATYYELRRNK